MAGEGVLAASAAVMQAYTSERFFSNWFVMGICKEPVDLVDRNEKLSLAA